MSRFGFAYGQYCDQIFRILIQDRSLDVAITDNSAVKKALKKICNDETLKNRLLNTAITESERKKYLKPFFDFFADETDPSSGANIFNGFVKYL